MHGHTPSSRVQTPNQGAPRVQGSKGPSSNLGTPGAHVQSALTTMTDLARSFLGEVQGMRGKEGEGQAAQEVEGMRGKGGKGQAQRWSSRCGCAHMGVGVVGVGVPAWVWE